MADTEYVLADYNKKQKEATGASVVSMFNQSYELEKSLQNGFSQIQQQIDQSVSRVNELAATVGTAQYVNEGSVLQEIKNGFSQIEAGITNAALSSVGKRMLELDSYLGSSSSDARAAVRFRMAGEVTNGLMREAFQAVAQVKEQQLDRITAARLNIAQANAGILSARTNAFNVHANAITNLTAQTANLYGAQADMMTGLHMARLDAANAEANRELEREKMAQDYKLALASMRQQSSQFAQQMSFNYDELNQQDKQFADNLSLQYSQINSQQRMFNAELQYKQDSFLSELGFKYDQLDLQTWMFNQEQMSQYDMFNRELDYKYDAMLSQEAMFGSELGFKYDSLKQQWEEMVYKAKNEEDLNKANQKFQRDLARFEQENQKELIDLQAKQMAAGTDVQMRSLYLEAYKSGALGGIPYSVDRQLQTSSGTLTMTDTRTSGYLSYDEWLAGKSPSSTIPYGTGIHW